MGFLSILLGLVDPISRIAGKIADYKIASQHASTDRERVAADERVKGLEARRDVMISEAGSRLNVFVRAGFALPFVAYNFKLVVYDKMLGWGSTDPLSTELFQVEIACIGFYFLHSIFAGVRR